MQMALLSSLKQIAGSDSSSISQAFMPEFFKLVLGTLSLPIDLPCTNYRRGLQVKFSGNFLKKFPYLLQILLTFNSFHFVIQARKNIVSMLRQLVEERRASKETHQDLLGCLMKSEESRYKLTDEEIIDQIITILYSGYETVSTTSMMAVKYLHDHPRVLQELRVS